MEKRIDELTENEWREMNREKWKCVGCDENHVTSEDKWHCVCCDVLVELINIDKHKESEKHHNKEKKFKYFNFKDQIMRHMMDNFHDRRYVNYELYNDFYDKLDEIQKIELIEACKFKCAKNYDYFKKYKLDGLIDFIDYRIFIRRMELSGVNVYKEYNKKFGRRKK